MSGRGAADTRPAGVSVAVLVDEASDAGVLAWLSDRAATDGAQLDGPGGLLSALGSTVQERRTEPTSFAVTWDPTGLPAITVECEPGCTFAEIRDACLFIAATCTDLRPTVGINRAGQPVQRL